MRCSSLRKDGEAEKPNSDEILHSKSKNKILLCPACGGKNVELLSKFDAWLLPKRYLCKSCGYLGPIILEVEKER